VRTYSSLEGRHVVTESGCALGKCRDLRAALARGRPLVNAVVVGRAGWLEHLGIGRRRGRKDAVPWDAVVRLEGDRIVVRDGTELQ
jgi:sporulation protein YlmC with PRC-barrel domain